MHKEAYSVGHSILDIYRNTETIYFILGQDFGRYNLCHGCGCANPSTIQYPYGGFKRSCYSNLLEIWQPAATN